jgi:hypothetical protein
MSSTLNQLPHAEGGDKRSLAALGMMIITAVTILSCRFREQQFDMWRALLEYQEV